MLKELFKSLWLYLIILGIFCFSVWGAKVGLIPCLLGELFFFRTCSFRKIEIYKDFFSIRWWIFSNFGIIVMACVSLVFCFDVYQTSIAILNSLIVPLASALVLFLIFKHISWQDQRLGIILIFAIFVLHSVSTIVEYLISDSSRSTGISNHYVIPICILLLIPLALSLSLFIYTRFKILAIILMGVSLFALYANGTRASILSVGAMFFCSILYPQYKYKKVILTLATFVFILGIGILIEWSGHQKARFNFKHMIEKVGIIWNYNPAEMGRFDPKCFNGIYQCKSESGVGIDSRFTFESNALQRLSLNKMGIEIIGVNPFVPHGFFPLYFDLNVPYNTKKSTLHYIEDQGPMRFHQHMQNAFLSAFFELGLVGGCFYVFSFAVLIFLSWRVRNFYGLLLFVWIIGIIPQNLFDVPFGFTGITFVYFSIVAFLLGQMLKDLKSEKTF